MPIVEQEFDYVALEKGRWAVMRREFGKPWVAMHFECYEDAARLMVEQLRDRSRDGQALLRALKIGMPITRMIS